MDSSLTRRGFVGVGGALVGSAAALPLLSSQSARAATRSSIDGYAPPLRKRPLSDGIVPVQAQGIPTVPFTMDNGVKVFRLSAEPVTLQWPDMSDGMGMNQRPIEAWGYNGSSPGPTFEVTEGDTVRIIFTNNLPEPSTIHWHGLHIPIEMDGIPDFSQVPVMPGSSFTYEFTLIQSGTYFYHSHVMGARQVGLGLMGFFIIHPKDPPDWYFVDHDYLFFLHTWKIRPGSPSPDLMEMSEFNYFTMNGQPGPQIPPMNARIGDKVRIRTTNLSMLAHPIHVHGHTFKIVELGAGLLPPHQHMSANTVNISSAEVRVVDFMAERPGKWLFHCHFSHHIMNDMHRLPLPTNAPMGSMNMDMGGMHTWIDIKA
jgi:FtsP/CotA-like multicopper oxidase with cupredoxin domain